MSAEFPNPCCRCGYCCLSETCPGIRSWIKGLGKYDRCPELSFEGDKATCRVATVLPHLIGAGEGCCIRARCIKDGIIYDFASIPGPMKRELAQALKKKQEATV